MDILTIVKNAIAGLTAIKREKKREINLSPRGYYQPNMRRTGISQQKREARKIRNRNRNKRK